MSTLLEKRQKMIVLKKFFSIFFCCFVLFFLTYPSTFSSSEKVFLYLKKQAIQELKLSSLGYKNNQLLKFKTFEYSKSKLFSLGNINRKVLIKLTKEKKSFYSYSQSILSDVKTLSQIDIWDFLSYYKNREQGMKEYLFLAKSSLKKGTEQQRFLENSLNGIKEKISGQKNILKKSEKNFLKILSTHNKSKIELAKKEVLSQTIILKKMQTDFEQKKLEYNELSPYVKKLKKNILAIEENKDALIKNVKTKKYSGEFIGVIEK